MIALVPCQLKQIRSETCQRWIGQKLPSSLTEIKFRLEILTHDGPHVDLADAHPAVKASMKPPKETTDSPTQAAWWACPGVLYFFAAGNPPAAVKIGVTAITNGGTLREGVNRRFKQIQSSNRETIELLGLVYFADGQYPTRSAEVRERELHIQFAAQQRFKPGTRGGEWFTPSLELLIYIREKSQPPEMHGVPRFIGHAINRT